MKRFVFFISTIILFSTLCWGQTWKLTETMTGTLKNGILTISTTANAEAMPDYLIPYITDPYNDENKTLWYESRYEILSVIIENNVTTIGNSAFARCEQLASITIPNSVTTIGDNAFFACTALTSITIPHSVTTIGHGAFFGCSHLSAIRVDTGNTTFSSDAEGMLYNKNKSVLLMCPAGKSEALTISNSVTTIRDSAFYWCNLTSITIPNSVTEIGNCVFYGCTRLTAITIPNSVTKIGINAFYYCEQLAAITIPSSVTTIENYAFSHCRGLTAITIPNSITRIGSFAFQVCIQLTSVTIPHLVTTIGEAVFFGCEKLTSIRVDAENTAYSSDAEGVLYNKNKTLLHTCPAGKSGTVTIPSSVKEIGYMAFALCNQITAIKIPGSVTSFGTNCFAWCDNLREVTVAWMTPFPLSADDMGFNSPIESFRYTYIYNATLYVPIGTKSLYAAAEVWELFKTIEEYDPTSGNKNIDAPTLKVYGSNGFLHITELQPGNPLSIYNLAGQIVYHNTPKEMELHIPLNANGIYIVSTGNQIFKVIIK